MSDSWKAQAERSSPVVLNLIIALALRLGRRLTRLLLPPIVLYFLLTAPAARRASRDFLRRVLPRPVRWTDLYRHLHTFAACILDRIYLLDGRLGEFDLRVPNPSTMLRPQPGQRGCLTLVSHLGSFDVMRVLGAQRKRLDFRILMDRAHGRMLQGALERLNPHFAREVIDAGEGGPGLVLALKEALEQGHMVGIMADRVRGDEPSVEVDFLGGRARLPAAPWIFAAALKAPVQLCFGLYLGGRRYELHFENLSAGLELPRGARMQRVQVLAQGYADRLAHYARLAPYNWFNFYDFWIDDAAAR